MSGITPYQGVTPQYPSYSLNDCPSNILKEIFRHMPTFKSWGILSLVSKQWSCILEQPLGDSFNRFFYIDSIKNPSQLDFLSAIETPEKLTRATRYLFKRIIEETYEPDLKQKLHLRFSFLKAKQQCDSDPRGSPTKDLHAIKTLKTILKSTPPKEIENIILFLLVEMKWDNRNKSMSSNEIVDILKYLVCDKDSPEQDRTQASMWLIKMHYAGRSKGLCDQKAILKLASILNDTNACENDRAEAYFLAAKLQWERRINVMTLENVVEVLTILGDNTLIKHSLRKEATDLLTEVQKAHSKKPSEDYQTINN